MTGTSKTVPRGVPIVLIVLVVNRYSRRCAYVADSEPRPRREGRDKMLGTIIREIPERLLPHG